jgi:hypothetical protein
MVSWKSNFKQTYRTFSYLCEKIEVRNALFVKIKISKSFPLSLVKMKDCPPTMKKYVIYVRYLISFSLMGIILFNFTQEWLFIKSKIWKKER